MKHYLVILFITSMFASTSCNAQSQNNSSSKTTVQTVEVFYFHYSRRCMTCNAVEAETKKALEALYPAQMKAGTITFKSVNLDEDSSKSDAEKCKAAGQSLLIIKGETKVDLTSQGFMYAKSTPEKLQAEIKKTIDPLL